MALELLSLIAALVIRHLPDVPILLRIGIHSGRFISVNSNTEW
ncbi:unnamed protein product [Dibothriocephalus latus]|uniref:Guanylate cyclase domain-containing protein n=1 Tax=Dibothriocephalus latus TaxID=60516 RepID=A0A3P7P5P0_DIBLA|nr:unnamed protein product [Dibothriocephalus latus]